MEQDILEFTDWMRSADGQLSNSEKNVGQDLHTLLSQREKHVQFEDDVKDQKGDLRFIRKAITTFTDTSKV